MRPLVITDEVRADILKLKQYAETNECFIDEMKEIMAGTSPPRGDVPEHSIRIHKGYRVVYTVEEQPMGFCRHISISVDDFTKCPNPYAVDMILEEFGFNSRFKDPVKAVFNLENEHDDEMPTAVNLIELI